MIKNYITIALRVLGQNKVYVAINLISLGFAIACCIISYINFSYTREFDSVYRDTDNIYRLNNVTNAKGSFQSWGIVPLPITEAVENEISGIEQTARLYSTGKLVKHKDHVFHEQLYYADKNLFTFFNFPLKYGSLENFQAHTVMIGETFAKKYFGNEVPVGKDVILLNKEGKEEIFSVSGVIASPPANSSFQFDIVTVFSNAFKENLSRNDWTDKNFITTFVRVKDGSSLANLETSLKPYAGLHNQANQNRTIERFYLQPFHDIAFTSERDFSSFVESRSMQPNPRGVVVIVPIVMSILIVLITCFNFINISIAFSNRRLKEIGMRKVFGGMRKQLIFQFLTENIILCLLASGIAVTSVAFLLPKINALTGFDLAFNFGSNGRIWIFLIVLPLAIAIISGMYPATYISAFKPLSILKGKTKVGAISGFTKFLLTAQFIISCIALIMGIILTENANYQQQVDYGYDIDHVLVVEVDNEQEFTIFTDAIRQEPEIENIAGAVHQIAEWNSAYQTTVNNDGNTFQTFVAHVEGEAYMRTMGLRLIEGRHFHAGRGLDADQSIIVNKTFVRQHNLKEPIGKQVVLDSSRFTIVGVMDDYKQLGLHAIVPPCVLRMAQPEEFQYAVVRSHGNLQQLNGKMEKAWNKTVINKPYSAFLQSDVVSKERELNGGFRTIAIVLALVTIVLSAGGLFALVSLNIIKRQKEIGMRKVLGATVAQLIILMNKDLMRLMVISFVVGSVLGYLVVNNLIFRFILVYHADIGPGSFLITLGLLVTSCALTVGFKVYRAATSNPVDVLRSE